MKTIEELLKNLARPEVLEFGLVTNRLPSVNIGGKFEPVDDEAPSNERLMQMLVTMGGSRYVDSLSDKPVQWTTRLDGVGVIAVAAILRKDVVQARFTVSKRETAVAAAAPAARAPTTAMPAQRPESGGGMAASANQAAAQPASGAQPQAQPASSAQTRAAQPQASSSPMAAAKQASVPGQQAAPIQPQVIKSVGSPSAQLPVAPPSAPAPVPPPPEEEWDDDDEPTLQTLSPPVKAPSGEARPKPARRPEEISRPDAQEVKAAQEKAAQEKAAQEKAAQEKAAQEKAAQEKAAQEKAAAEQRAAQERAAAERLNQERAAQERAAQERERAAAEQRAAQERVAQERAAHEKATVELVRIREQRAAQDRQAREAAARSDAARAKSPIGGRRISTPTSVDAVDVEITTQDAGSKPSPIAIDLDADGVESTVTVPGDARDQAVAKPPPQATAPVPSPAPGPVAEKERPRVDPAASIDAFVAMAVAARASDLHIIAGRPALLRVATDLLPRTQAVPAEQVERITKEIVPPRLRDVLDRDGACDFAIEHPAHGRFRVNASRHRTGFKLSLRVIPKEIPTLAALGLPDAVANALRHQRGLILITGLASQGKSTTLAALVDHLNRETARHIVTIEEPLEHVHPRKKSLVSQREVGLHTRSKGRAIHGTMHEDADVVAIGEVNDAESLRLALDVAESGRLVLATMNAPSATKAIERIIDWFPTAERGKIRSTFAGALRLAIGQKLVPSADRTRLHVAVELLPWSVALYTLVRDGRTQQIASLSQQIAGKALGIVRLHESLGELVRAHKITAEVARQYAEPSADLENPVARPAAAATGAQGRK